MKNATGVDSLESSRRDQTMRACRWLENAGVAVPKNDDGSPAITVGIDPRFALDGEALSKCVDDIPPLEPGGAIWIE